MSEPISHFSLTRISHDFAYLEANKIPNVMYIRSEKDIRKLLALIRVVEGPFIGMLIPIIITLANNHPHGMPRTDIPVDFPLNSYYHAHVFPGSGLCMSISVNYAWFFDSNEEENKNRWVSAFSVTTLLMQLSIFFTDTEIIERRVSEVKINELRAKLATFTLGNIEGFSEEIKNFMDKEGTIQFYTEQIALIAPEVREPEVREPEVREPEVREPDVREPDVREPDVREPEVQRLCSMSHTYEPTYIFGYPLEITTTKENKKKFRIFSEVISHDAFQFMNDNKQGFKTPLGNVFDNFLPIYIDETHGVESKIIFENVISEITRGMFDSDNALKILLCIIQQTLVKMFNGNTHESENLITAYGNLIRLLIALIEWYPEIKDIIKNKIDGFKTSLEQRHKNKIEDIGEFLILCFLPNIYTDMPLGYNEIKTELLFEYYARQIRWILDGAKKFEIETNVDLNFAFNACKIASKLLLFGIQVANIVITPDFKVRFDGNNGFFEKEIMAELQCIIKTIKNNYNSFPYLFQALDISISAFNESPDPNPNVQARLFLHRCNLLSQLQDYTCYEE